MVSFSNGNNTPTTICGFSNVDNTSTNVEMEMNENISTNSFLQIAPSIILDSPRGTKRSIDEIYTDLRKYKGPRQGQSSEISNKDINEETKQSEREQLDFIKTGLRILCKTNSTDMINFFIAHGHLIDDNFDVVHINNLYGKMISENKIDDLIRVLSGWKNADKAISRVLTSYIFLEGADINYAESCLKYLTNSKAQIENMIRTRKSW